MDKPKATPKDFFLWLGAMVSLYVSAVSFILLIHQYINVWFPSEFESYGDPYSGTIRFAIASLIVVFPLYIWLTRILHQDLRQSPEKKELWVRRWMVFLTLFVAGVTIAIDLIALINTFLEGDLTTRFALKALTILVVLGGGFWYYLNELKGRWEARESQSKMIGGFVALVVLASIIGGFFIIGSPMEQRLVKLDDQKISDLQNIQWQLVNYYQQKQELPATLALLEDPISGFIVPVDKETGMPYRYELKGSLTFLLCATFNQDKSVMYSRSPEIATPIGIKGDLTNSTWQHAAGEVCFDRTIDPERYPVFQK